MPENTKENRNMQNTNKSSDEGRRNGGNRHGNHHGNYHGKTRHGNQGSNKIRGERNAEAIDVNEALAEAREDASVNLADTAVTANERQEAQNNDVRQNRQGGQNQRQGRDPRQNKGPRDDNRNRQNGSKPEDRRDNSSRDASRNENNRGNANSGRDTERGNSRDADRNSNRDNRRDNRDNRDNSAGGNQSRRDRNFRDKRDRRDGRRDENAAPAEEKLPDSLSTDSIFTPAQKEENFLGISQDDEAIIDSMPPDPTLDAVFNEPEPIREREDGVEIVGIHFPGAGKVYYFDPAGIRFEKGSYAIVETARGQELGEVAIANRKVAEEDIVQPLKPVVRQAVKEDLLHQEQNEKREAEALAVCRQKVLDHKLDMKLTGSQYTFDNAKLIFYFTAAQRVDFRELVKDLATTFHTRIELRQIGTRDEARMLGGLGVCGRKLCCSGFLPNYAQVSIKMAKKQGLALNSAKISGNCGRLMCCLRYEESTYERELALMPTVDSIVDTPEGRGKVTDVRPVGYTVKVKLDEKADAAPKAFALADIRVIVRAAEKNDDGDDDKNEEN